jgi:dethiobiotin synthetase
MRPLTIVLVTGTGTEIGKTWLSVEILHALRRLQLSVAARKPAQSFDPCEGKTDADLLAVASGETPERVCPKHRWYPAPMAPPMAAASLGMRPPLLSDLLDETASSWPEQSVDIGIIEGAGGVASPIAIDGDTTAMAKKLGPDIVVLVADGELGTINDVRLSCRALEPVPVVVYLNRFDWARELHARNRAWLSDVDGLQVSCDRDDLVARLCHLCHAGDGTEHRGQDPSS